MLEISDQLRRHAAWVEEHLPPVDLPTDASGPVPVHPDGTERRRRASRRVWALLGTAALIALVVAGLVVLRSRPGPPVATDPAAEQSGLAATGPDSVLLPRSTPDGLQAVGVRTSIPTARQRFGIESTGPTISQLFGVDQRADLLLTIEPSSTGGDQEGGVVQTIRGTTGRFMAAGQPTIVVTPGGASYSTRTDEANARYSWYERDAFITASFRNLAAPEALAIIDGLQWASPDLVEGFVPADDAGLATLVPATSEPTSGVGQEADIDYLVEPDGSTSIKLVTCPAGARTCPGATYDLATAWLNGTRTADGTITASVDGHEIQPGWSTHGYYLQIWPDGATAQVDFGVGRAADPEVGRRLVADLAVTDRSGLARLEDEVAAGLQTMPVLAAADLSGGRVEVHGLGLVSVTCLAPNGAPSTCGSAWVGDGPGSNPTTPINASAIVDGHWIVGASSTNPGTIAFASGDSIDFDHPAGPPLFGETTAVTAGGTTYQLGLVAVPDGVTGIMLTQSTSGGIGGGSVQRPA